MKKFTYLIAAVLLSFMNNCFAETFLYFNSQQGDFIGLGKVQTWTPVQGSFAAAGVEGLGDVHIYFQGDSDWWSLYFAAPVNQPLQVGAYENATRSIAESPSNPGLDIGGDGHGCNALTGRFDIFEISYVNGQIASFAADFEQHCDGSKPALFGAILYNASANFPNSTARFSSPSYTVSEAAGSIQIDVVRDNPISNGVSVDYATSDGTGKAGVDYTAVSGTLVFAAGQNTASFNIPILKDVANLNDTSVALTLGNPQNGAVLGTPATAQLTIADAHVLTTDYFPSAPGDLWVYARSDTSQPETVKVLFQNAVVNGVKTRIVAGSVDKSKLYFSDDGLHRAYGPLNFQKNGVEYVKYGTITFVPPILGVPALAEIGQTYNSQGTVYINVPGLGSVSLPYTSNKDFLGFDVVTVPAGTYDVIKLQTSLRIGQGPVTKENLYYAKGIGKVKGIFDTPNDSTTSELQDTNVWKHDLAVTKILPSAKVALTASIPSVSKTVKVQIQNRSPFVETIANAEELQKLVQLQAVSLGACPDPEVTLPITDKLQKLMPIELKPKKYLTLNYAVVFNCANDLSSGAGHEDFHYTATVDHSVLDSLADVHTDDDVCPRSVAPPYVIDVYPDGTVKDKGCGAKKPDGTLGAQVLSDVISQ